MTATSIVGQAETRGAARVRGGALVPLAVFILVAVATRAVWFGDPVADFDEQIYSLIGWRMTHGDIPYADLWDRKPFGLFAIFAVCHWLFGPEPLAYQLVSAFAAIGGAWLVYLLSQTLVDRVSATLAGTLYLILMAAYGSFSAQSEIFHAPLMLLMLWLVRDWDHPDAMRRALWAMLIGGFALQIKYTVVPQCAFFGLYALYGQWRRGARIGQLGRLAIAFAVLGLLPTLLVAALFGARGAFHQFWFANFVSFFLREPSEFGRLWPGTSVGMVPIGALIALGLFAAFRLNPPKDRQVYLLYCGWAASALVTVLLPATTYLYYYGALVPAAVLVASPLVDRRSFPGLIPGILFALAMLGAVNPVARSIHSQTERRTEQRLSNAIAHHVGSKRDCLYIFDGPAVLYRTTGTCTLTRFVYPDHLNNALERHSLGVSQVGEIARILTHRPRVIVTADLPVTVQCDECKALIARTLRADYRPLITSSLHGRMITAWVRRDTET